MVNQKIYEQLEAFNVKNKEAAVLYLLAVYYKIPPEGTIAQEIITQVNLTKIVERDYNTNTVKWKIPLFSSDNIVVDDNWAWVLEEYRMLWMNVRGSKGGDRATCITKMKQFFANNPHIRKEDIMKAAKFYTKDFISGGNNPTYMIEADNFIYKKVEKVNRSKLEQMLEVIRSQVRVQQTDANRYEGKIK